MAALFIRDAKSLPQAFSDLLLTTPQSRTVSHKYPWLREKPCVNRCVHTCMPVCARARVCVHGGLGRRELRIDLGLTVTGPHLIPRVQEIRQLV